MQDITEDKCILLNEHGLSWNIGGCTVHWAAAYAFSQSLTHHCSVSLAGLPECWLSLCEHHQQSHPENDENYYLVKEWYCTKQYAANIIYKAYGMQLSYGVNRVVDVFFFKLTFAKSSRTPDLLQNLSLWIHWASWAVADHVHNPLQHHQHLSSPPAAKKLRSVKPKIN